MVASKDKRGVPARQMGARRNSDSGKRTKSGISDALNRQVVSEPNSGVHRLKGLVSDNMLSLNTSVAEARAFLTEAKTRNAAGELDRHTHAAEAAPANVVVVLHTTLEIMFRKADETDDKASLQAVAWATGALAEHLSRDGSITARKKYPENPVLRTAMVQERKEKARRLFDSIVDNESVQQAAHALGVGIVNVDLILQAI